MKLKGQDWPEGAWFLFYGSGAFVHFVHPDGYEFTINEDGKSLQLYVHERREEWEPAEFYQGQVSAVRRVENPAWTEAYRSGTHLRSPVFVRTLKRFWSAVKSGVLVKVSE